MEEESNDVELPRFANSIFGYDRYQVEEYLARLQEWATDSHWRAEEAERRAAELEEQLEALRGSDPQGEPEAREGTGDHGPLLGEARREAAEILAAARRRAEQILTEAQLREADAGRMLQSARAEADAVRQKALEEPGSGSSGARPDAPTAGETATDAPGEGGGDGIVEGVLSRLSDELDRAVGRLEQLQNDLVDRNP